MIVFVTGFHRAGTHTWAQKLASDNHIFWIAENVIRWDSIEAVHCLLAGKWPKWKLENGKWTLTLIPMSSLKDGFVLQCPGLAHKTLELVKHGKVYWATKDKLDLIASMRNSGINEMAWHIMKGFREEFSDDPIWPTLTYDGSEDAHDGFVRYYKLLCEVKTYFYETRFKGHCELVRLEDLPGYDRSKSMAGMKPLKVRELRAVA